MPAIRSYVISAALDKRLYRHIRISADATLERLSQAILDAYGFEADHAYAFFMNGRVWDGEEAYYCPLLEDAERTADEAQLGELGLRVGAKFIYLFDFGEEWSFDCRVLEASGEPAGEPSVVRSAGKAPEQYPDEEDWEAEWDEDALLWDGDDIDYDDEEDYVDDEDEELDEDEFD